MNPQSNAEVSKLRGACVSHQMMNKTLRGACFSHKIIKQTFRGACVSQEMIKQTLGGASVSQEMMIHIYIFVFYIINFINQIDCFDGL